ncbi:MAG: hypothetical protein AAGA92_05375 [Planctomycetota bacterium]
MSEESDNFEEDQPRLPRFSLRAILALMAVACVLLAPTRFFGMGYLMNLCFSLGVAFLTIRAHLSRGSAFGLTVSLGLAVVGFVLLMLSPTFFFHTVVNAVASFLLLLSSAAKRHAAKTVIASIAAALVVPYAATMGFGIKNLRAYDRLRTEVPMVDLTPRLEGLRQTSGAGTSLGTLAKDVQKNLSEQQERSEPWFFGRYRLLQDLHDDSYRRFVAAQGFGPGRMINRFYPERYEPLEASPSASSLALPLPLSNRYRAQADEIHTVAMGEFLDPDRIGYVRSIEEVAGFEGHAFTHLPKWASESDTSDGWQLTRLQLVSLLRHNEPLVYLTDELPQMEEIAEFPNRPLNDFETKALPKIQTHADVYVDEGEDLIEMLGAVRADQSCIVCHGGRRGDLLGAFSYELRRENPAD